jgi:hypothetical protein
VCFHGLRRTCATLMRHSGVDAFTTMRVLGHQSEKRYAHADAPALRQGSRPFEQMLVKHLGPAPMPALHFDIVAARVTYFPWAFTYHSPTEVIPMTSGPLLPMKNPPISRRVTVVEPRGIEPLTSGLQSPRSPS